MNYETQTLENQDEASSQATNILLDTKNIAKHLSEQDLITIGKDVQRGFEADLESRHDWEQNLDDWLKLATQHKDTKTWPWPRAANIKYPLLSTAAMQFAARAYPTLVPSNGNIVKCQVLGKDQDGQKEDKADRISTYMSWQVLHQMDSWEENMDKLLMQLPIIGVVFKKTFYSKAKDKLDSYVVNPKDLVVNYWAQSLETAERVSEIIQISPRILKERQLQGIYLDVDLGTAPAPDEGEKSNQSPPNDETTPYILIEQHTFLDLDKDGYQEPYIVTFHRETGKVLRIQARYFQEDVEYEGKTIIKISPRNFYTKYSFIPNPDGSFYDIGFGTLLGPLNEAINTNINQLTDSGTINNLQSGFIGKGLRIKMGDSKFTPGEWKPVNSTADDLRKQIVPLPSKEPSKVLLDLMQVLITSGKELASVAEIFVGKMPGQNTPATTTMASIEQGMKVFTAVYKRVYRSLETEFKKIFELNSLYLDPNTYVAIVEQPLNPEDFDEDVYDVCPSADPTAVSQTEKLVKAQALGELVAQFGPILDPVEVVRRILVAQEHPNWEKLFNQQIQQTGQFESPPDPKMMEMQMKSQAEQEKIQLQAQAQQHKMELEARDKQVQLAMKAQEHALDMEHKQQMAQVESAVALHKQRIFQVEEAQKLRQQEQTHQQTMKHNEEKSSLQKKTMKSGGQTQPQKPSSKK